MNGPALRPYVADRYPAFLRDLRTLVGIDSGSYNAAGVNKVGDFCAERLTALGCSVERVPPADGLPLGDAVVGRRTGPGTRRLLLVAHMDTVFDDGTAATRPFRTAGDFAFGPGVTDDKAGLVAGITAIEALAAAGAETYGEVVMVCSPDEEIGAPGSRALIRRLAAETDVALCLECAREDGAIVKARKGIADVELTVRGRAAHAGIEPERGANAALAAARLLIALQDLNGRWPDVTVNVGVVRAGSRVNVVCPEARMAAEVRADTPAGLTAALDTIDALAARPSVPGTHVEVRRSGVVQPMETAPELLDAADEVAGTLGLTLKAVATGGVADANLTAAAGARTLDGLGPVGGGDHSPDEWLDLTTIVPRVTLLAALIARLGSP